MAKTSRVTQDHSAPIGFNLYQDQKNRTIYKYPFSKKAVYIPVYDYKTFELYRKRHILVISVFVVIFTFLSEWFNLPWWVSVLCSLVLWAAIEFKFYRFLQKEQPVKHFKPNEYTGYYDNFEIQDINKIIIKTVLYILLGALIVCNSYYSNYQGMYLVASWFVLAVCVIYAIFQITVTIKAKNHKK